MRRTPGPLPILIRLARQQMLQRSRALRTRGRTVTTIVMGLFAAYLGFTLFTLGAFLPVFTEQMAPGASPIALVDEHALPTLIGLFFLRFLLQKTPRMAVEPYRHLPVSSGVLVGFFASSSVFSIHNLFPLVFAIPFAVVQLSPHHGTAGAAMWVAGVVTCLLASNFANLYIRSQLNQREKSFLAGLGLLLVLTMLDEYLGAGVLGRLSLALFGRLHSPSVLLSVAMGLVVAGTYVLAVGALLQSLRTEGDSAVPVQRNGRLHELAERWDLAGHLIWLELRLMWRNRRPRHYVAVSIMFSTVYLVFLLAAPSEYGGVAYGAVIGLFASGGLVLNYGQLMFAWDSNYFEGLMARSVDVLTLIRAKTVVLQASCLVLFVISLPLFLWLRPDLVPLHVGFLFYNAGITTQIVLELATRNEERLDIGRAGGFFNYEGFSARHWFWFLPTALPPTLLLLVLRNTPNLAWTVLAATGLLGLISTELWTRRHARRVERRRHAMIAGFAVR